MDHDGLLRRRRSSDRVTRPRASRVPSAWATTSVLRPSSPAISPARVAPLAIAPSTER